MRRSSTSITTAAAALAALALAAPAAVAQPSADRADQVDPAVTDGQELTQEVARAVQEAQQQAQGQVRLKSTPPGRATDATRMLDAGMAKMVADGAIGVTARVETPDLDWRGSAGLRDVDGRAPAGWQDRFLVASNTKTMIATLVLQEVEAGSWVLDTRVEDVIPGLFPDHPDVTIRQLLSHTSGAPTGTDHLIARHISDPTSLEDLLYALGRDYQDQEHIDVINELEWAPAGQFSYSNAGYVALGMLLEAQTGRTVEDLLRQRIFRVVGMPHTSYPDDPGVNGPTLQEDAWLGFGWLELAGFDPEVFSHAGAAVSTTRDLNAFSEALLTGELVDPVLVEEMMTPITDDVMEYGLGMYRVPDPCSSPEDPQWLYGHDGASYGTFSIVLSSPDASRQLSIGATGRDLASPLEPRWDFGDVLIPALLATC